MFLLYGFTLIKLESLRFLDILILNGTLINMSLVMLRTVM